MADDLGKSAKDDAGARAVKRIGFLLIEDFPLMSLGSALEVLRHANRFSLDGDRYDYFTYAPGAGVVSASNGLSVQTYQDLDPDARPDLLLVCAGTNYARGETPENKAWLRRLSRAGVPLGGISAGAFLLASAGLLDGYRCAVHWADSGVFREMYPEIDLTDNVFVMDRDRYTCSGGATTIDMMLRIVADDLGAEAAARVAEMMLVEKVRSTLDKQASAALYRAKARSKALARAIEAMEHALDAPLSMVELAEHAGLTRRQLHRLFRQHTGGTPTDFYRDLRLRRARSLLQGTPSKVIDVALACGFGSHSHFTKVYREHFGVSPLQDRRAEL